MDKIKVSLTKPISRNLPITDISAMTESDGILSVVMNNDIHNSIRKGDTIILTRTIEVERDYLIDSPIEDGTSYKDVCARYATDVITSVGNTFTIKAPVNRLQISNISGHFVTFSENSDIFYQDLDYARTHGGDYRLIHGVSGTSISAITTDSNIGIPMSYYYPSKTINCNSGETRFYDYYFLPLRESKNSVYAEDVSLFSIGNVINVSQNQFYYKDLSGNCVFWPEISEYSASPQTITTMYKDNSYWKVPIGFSVDNDYNRMFREELANTNLANGVYANDIPDVIDMERVKYAPIISEFSSSNKQEAESIIFKLHFRLRDKKDWSIIRDSGWEGFNRYTDITSQRINDSESDLMNALGFVDDDIMYQKMKVQKSFLRLSFYDNNDPLDSSLLYYSTIYLDSGVLYGKFMKDSLMLKTSGVTFEGDDFVIRSSADMDNRVDSKIVIKDEYDSEFSSEGYNFYLFSADAQNSVKTIYMKVEFNHAGYGRTIPMIMWPFEGSVSKELSMDNYFESLYIPVEIGYIKDRYYYRFNTNNPCFKISDGNIIINLFEPKFEKLT